MIPYNAMDFSRYGISANEIIVYLRKSRSDDPLLTVEEVLQRHETILDEWAERNIDAAIPEENRFREVVSGETIEARPEIQKILKLIESPRYKAILTVEVQRLSRGDLEDAGRLIKILRYTNTIVITPQKTYNLNDEYDRDFFERELKRGNEFLEYQKKIMNRGRLLSVSQGNYIGSVPPYGYKKIWKKDGKKDYPTLEPIPEQAEIVKQIFDMFVHQDLGRHNICTYLDTAGIKPPSGEYWSPPSVRDMLMNVHYIGKVKWFAQKEVMTVADGEIKKSRLRQKDYLIYDGRHPAIIDEETFKLAQEKIGRNPRTKPNQKIRNPFAGLLHCSCGRAMSLRTYKRKDGSERNAPRLLCDGQTHCGSGSCLYTDILERVIDALQQAIADFELHLENNDANNAVLHAQMIKQLEDRLEELNARELAQWEQQSHPDPAQRMPAHIFQKLNEKIQEERAEVHEALAHLYDSAPPPVDYTERVATFREALEALKDPDADTALKNNLLRKCIDGMVYTRERPERVKREPGEKRGTRLRVGGKWTDPPITLDIKLRV